jgi:hypothetical protein
VLRSLFKIFCLLLLRAVSQCNCYEATAGRAARPGVGRTGYRTLSLSHRATGHRPHSTLTAHAAASQLIPISHRSSTWPAPHTMPPCAPHLLVPTTTLFATSVDVSLPRPLDQCTPAPRISSSGHQWRAHARQPPANSHKRGHPTTYGPHAVIRRCPRHEHLYVALEGEATRRARSLPHSRVRRSLRRTA